MHTATGDKLRDLFTCVLIASIGACAPTQLHVKARVESLGVKPLPVSAALVMPNSLKNATLIKNVSCFDKYEIQIGKELKTGLMNAISQAVDSVVIVDDKATALGQFDLIIEPSSPELALDGRCITRRLTWLLVMYSQFINPKDTLDARIELHVNITNRNGDTLLEEAFKSVALTRDIQNSMVVGAGVESQVGDAVGEALKQVVEDLGQSISFSPKIRAYAQGLEKKPSTINAKAGDIVSVRASDVDLLPKVTSKPKNNRYAVVIGIEQYREHLPPANFAARDALTMKQYLTNLLGYPEEKVAVLLNDRATRTDLEKYIEQWLPIG